MRKVLFILFLFSHTAFAQGIVKGVVREHPTNQPLAGASIVLKNAGISTWATADGNFIFPVVEPGVYDVEISFVGYESQLHTIEVNGHDPVNLFVNLLPGQIQLADVLVVASTSRPLNTLSPLDIQLRPTQSAQDILRMVPGLFIAQHAGGGKAEQIFLRGFDIDHGTDINLEVDGIPVNMVSHAHGQGYSDLHFLIPEIVQWVDFDKGPYYADRGDFTTAGYVDFKTKNALERNFLKTEVGRFGMLRGAAGANFISPEITHQTGYVATEFFRSDGFFESPQNFNRLNLTGKFTSLLGERQKITFGAGYFTSRWNASGQIPERAVKSGEISRFGSIDDTEGGETGRINFYLKSGYQFRKGAQLEQQVYAVHYRFNLYSNFTFFLNDSLNGDQIQQKESRMLYGYKANYTTLSQFLGRELQTHAGGGIRYDDIRNLGLANTVKREFRSDVQRGNVAEANVNIFINETLILNNRWSLNAGVRLDYFMFNYHNLLTSSVSKESAAIVSPKLNLSFEANERTTFYVRSGTGFHSNDARVIIAQTVKNSLPRAVGADLGMYKKISNRILLQAALWRLDMEQEFVYVGDEGIVEAGGKTKRQGIDLSLRYQPWPWFFADTDITLADPSAKGLPDGMNNIPLAPNFSSIGGLTVKTKNGWNAGLRYRYLADRPANEANTVIADGYFLLDAVVNYTRPKFELGMTIENLLNRNWKEAQFDTESRLANETEAVSEIHFTPGTPFFAKVKLTYLF